MSDEKQYLEDLSQKLDEYVVRIQALPSGGNYEVLHQILNEILDVENNLRESCEIGERFNVIRMQLRILLERFEKEVAAMQGTVKPEVVQVERKLKPDQELVYVYLFNVQGASLKTWQKQLSPDALMEHSINRPIYVNKEEILKVLEAKPNKIQHAYLKIAIDKKDIVPPEGGPSKDQHGFILLKLKQGALKVGNIYSFFYDNKEYHVISGDFVLAS